MFEDKTDTEVQEIFIDACRNGMTDVVKNLLIDKRIDPAARDNISIGVAAQDGHLEITRMLLADSRVDPADYNNFAIVAAAQNNHLDILRLLLVDNRVDPAANNNQAIGVSSSEGNLDVVRLLLADQRVNPAGDNNFSIIAASVQGHAEVVRELLGDPRVNPGARNNEAIIRAAENGHVDVVRCLLQDKRVNPGDRNNEAIIRASENGHADIVRCLFQDERVNPGARDDEAIILASSRGHTDVVRLLLEDPYSRVNPASRTNRAILVAAAKGHIETVKLLSGDVRVNPGDFNNATIIISATRGHLDIVRFLLADHRVDPAAQDNMTIITAASHGHVSVVSLLLSDQRVDPAADNNAAIISAARHGRADVVRQLLEDQRVDPADSNNNAIVYASAHGHLEVVRILLADQRVDPVAQNNTAIVFAAASGNLEVVRELLADSRVDPSANNNAAIMMAIAHNNFDVAYLLALRLWPDMKNIPAIFQEYLPAIKEAGKTYCEQFIARHGLVFMTVSNNDGSWPSLYLLRNSEDIRKLKCESAISPLSITNDELLDSVVLPIQREVMPRDDFEDGLSKACADGNAVLVQKLLLDRMAGPAKSSKGLLNKALLNGCYEVAALLMIHDLTEQHAHLDFSSVFKSIEGNDDILDIDTAIYWASVYGDVNITKLLIKSGKVDKDSSNLVFYFKNAVSLGHHEVAYILARHIWQDKAEFRVKVSSYNCMEELRAVEERLNRCVEEEELSILAVDQKFKQLGNRVAFTNIIYTTLEFMGQGTLSAYGKHLRHIAASQAESQGSLSGGGGVPLMEQEKRATKRSRNDMAEESEARESVFGEDDFAGASISHTNTGADKETADLQDDDDSRRVGGRVKCLW